MKRLVWILVVVALVGGGWWALRRMDAGTPVEAARAQQGPIRQFVDEQAVTRLPETHLVTMPDNGRIMPIELVEGTPVSKGQIVAEMSPIDREIELAAAQAVVDRLEASIRENADTSVESTAQKQTRNFVDSMQSVVDAAAERVRSSEAQLNYAERNLARVRELRETGARTEQELEQAEVAHVDANVQYRQDQLVLNALQAMQAATILSPVLVQQYIDRKELSGAVLEQQRAEAVAHLDQVRTNQQRGTMASPINGVVLERHVSNERQVSAGTVLLTLGDLDLLEIEADILSQDVVQVKVGDQVEIYGPAVGRPVAHGTVKTIYPAGFTKVSSLGVEQQRVRVIVEFLPEDLRRLRSQRGLGVGYRVNVRIFTAERPRALVVPRSALFRGAADDWQVFAVRGGVARRQAVQVGLMNDERVEITEGLTDGEIVILAPETNLAEGSHVDPLIREWSP